MLSNRVGNVPLFECVKVEENFAIRGLGLFVVIHDLLDHPSKRNVRERMLGVVPRIATTDICIPSTYHSRTDLNVSERTRMASSKPDLFQIRLIEYLIGPALGDIRIGGCR